MTSPIALIVDRVRPEATAAARWLASHGDLHVYADARSPATEALAREVNAPLTISDQRALREPDGTLRLADETLARNLARVHEQAPWQAIVLATDAVLDPSWDQPSLGSVPLGRVLGGRMRRIPGVFADPHRFASEGADLVVLAGDVALCDFVVDPLALGHVFGRPLPPVVGAPPVVGGPSSEADGPVVVVASGDDVGAGVDAIVAAVQRQDGTVFVVSADPALGSSLSASLQPPDRERTILIGIDDPLVGTVVDQASEVIRVGARPDPTDGLLPPARPGLEPRVVGVASPADVAEHLRALDPADPRPSVLASDPETLAVRRRVTHADLGFACRRWEPLGEADPTRVRDDWLLVGRRARSAAVAAAMASTDLAQLVWRMAEPGLTSSAAIGLVPSPPTRTFLPLRTLRHVNDHPSRVSPPLLPMPNLAVESPPPPQTATGVKEWAGRSSWTTRIRLAMPWRFGLLPKAMKDRW